MNLRTIKIQLKYASLLQLLPEESSERNAVWLASTGKKLDRFGHRSSDTFNGRKKTLSVLWHRHKKITSNFGENRLGNNQNNQSINRVGWKLPTPIINVVSSRFSLSLYLALCTCSLLFFCFSRSIAVSTDISMGSYRSPFHWFSFLCEFGPCRNGHHEMYIYVCMCYWLVGWLASQRYYCSTLITRN